jgi:hypothetical protein
LIAGEPAGEFGVVERRRPHAQFGQARQILVGGVQHPFAGVEDVGDRRHHHRGVLAVVDGVDEHRARAGPPDLHQVGAVGVAEARRALGVDREGSVAAGEKLCRGQDLIGGDRQLGYAVGRRQQRGGLR